MGEIKILGDKTLCERTKTAFFCSRIAPKATSVVIEEWVRVISKEDYCVICGAQSPMEKYAFSLILQYKVPVILMLATAMPESWNDEIQAALDEKRLLVMTHCGEGVHRVTAKSASDRNRLILEMADNVVVGYCDEDGNIAKMLDGHDDVVYLLDENDSRVAPYVDFYEARSNASANNDYKVVRQWKGCMPTARGVLAFCFLGDGDERFLKISQQLDCGAATEEQPAIRLDFKELNDFNDALPRVCGCLARHEMISEGVVVESASGDVTFAADCLDDVRTLVIMQTKLFKSAVIRRGAIYVSQESLGLFIDMVKEAVSHFKD